VDYAHALLRELGSSHTLTLLAALLVTYVAVRTIAQSERRRLRALIVLSGLHLVLLPIVALLETVGSRATNGVMLGSMFFSVIALIGMAGIFLFGVILPRIGLAAPRILRDVVLAVATAVGLLAAADRAGFSVTGLITTSAVLTAVIGFSLQDTLGNVMGGLALQLDNSIQVGDWIKIGDLSGQVTEIRWRYTSIETRDWETVVVPNSVLLKGQVVVQGRRAGHPLQWRRTVSFHVDFRHAPALVIETVTHALCAWPIDRVSADPPPLCLLMELKDSVARYVVRYLLLDPRFDDGTDSVVRTRIISALQRVGVPLAIPAQAVFVTQETDDRKESKARDDMERRQRALSRVDLFDHLADGDREKLASRLQFAPFTRGEAMCRQGDPGDCLYLISDGEAAVRVAVNGVETEVARLGAGRFFGEMSLMTGEARSATVLALGDVKTYRLDKAAFQDVLHERPALAEEMAEVLARRRTELSAARENLDAAGRARMLAAEKSDFLGKIRSFFGMTEEGRRARA
jgi:small-conductance mechanosensitive channel/CRP-like cAMP-binding protein